MKEKGHFYTLSSIINGKYLLLFPVSFFLKKLFSLSFSLYFFSSESNVLYKKKKKFVTYPITHLLYINNNINNNSNLLII